MHIVSLDDETPAELLKSWHELRATTDLELEPNVPPPGFDEAFAHVISNGLFDRRGWLLVESGAVVAYVLVEFPKLDNPQLAELELRVDAVHRRSGNATRLLQLAAQAASDAGRRSILVEAVEGSAGDKACAALGAKSALGSTSSALRLTDLDQSLVENWIARRGERAEAYSLVRWIDHCPDDLVDQCVPLLNAMNTAPMGDLDLTIDWSPDSIRASELAHLNADRRSYVVCARHDATGELVALTHVLVPQGRPTLGVQEDTVVRPDHRERGLGRWIKAEMLLWLARDEPQLDQIITWNATENAAMRGINTELGFVAGDAWTERQFSTADLLAELARRK
ncbi:MAG: GNAT family N-acetyltransferase [Gaiellaceae bacterium]